MGVLSRITRIQLLRLLGSLAVLDAYEGRTLLLQDLPPALCNSIDRSVSKAVDLSSIVQACDKWGREALQLLIENALGLIEGSTASTQLQTILDDLPADQPLEGAGQSIPGLTSNPTPLAKGGGQPRIQSVESGSSTKDRSLPPQPASPLWAKVIMPLPRFREHALLYVSVLIVTIIVVFITQDIAYTAIASALDIKYSFGNWSYIPGVNYALYLIPAAMAPVFIVALLLRRVIALLPLAIGASLIQILDIVNLNPYYLNPFSIERTIVLGSVTVIIGILTSLLIFYFYFPMPNVSTATPPPMQPSDHQVMHYPITSNTTVATSLADQPNPPDLYGSDQHPPDPIPTEGDRVDTS